MPDTTEVSPAAFPSAGLWTPEQTKLALHFYCQTPFGQLHSRNKQVIELANFIGRTPGAVARKCGNLASLDPAIVASGRVGLQNHSQLDEEIWNEFHADWGRLAVECEQLRQQLRLEHGLEAESLDVTSDGFAITDYAGETREAILQQRIKQDFFRRAVLTSYRGRCCISGVADARLLVASHIVPWREDKANRLNPSNGLCLSAIHDKAFDQYLFTLSDDHRVVLSHSLKQTTDTFLREVFWAVEDKPIELPERFAPELSFIARHRMITLASMENRK